MDTPKIHFPPRQIFLWKKKMRSIISALLSEYPLGFFSQHGKAYSGMLLWRKSWARPVACGSRHADVPAAGGHSACAEGRAVTREWRRPRRRPTVSTHTLASQDRRPHASTFDLSGERLHYLLGVPLRQPDGGRPPPSSLAGGVGAASSRKILLGSSLRCSADSALGPWRRRDANGTKRTTLTSAWFA